MQQSKADPRHRRLLDIATTVSYCLVCVAFTAVLGVADRSVLFEYFPLWLVASVPLLVLAAEIQGKTAEYRGVAFLLVVVWLLVLPHIKWNDRKGFYMDCHSIDRGDSRESVYRTMSDYLATADEDESTDRVIFTPSRERSADWCVVEFQRDLVTRAYADPD